MQLTVLYCNGQSHYVDIHTSGSTPSSGGTIFDPSGVTVESGSCVTKSVFLPCNWTATAMPPTAITITPSSGVGGTLYQVEVCAISSGQVCFSYCETANTCVDIITTGSTGSTGDTQHYFPQGTAYTVNASAQTISIPFVGCLRSISSASFATATVAGQVISVAVQENPNETDRSVVLTVTWCDGTTQTITITQTQIFYDWRNIDPSVETICDECQCTTVGCQLTSSATSSWSICVNNQMSRTVSSLTRSCCQDGWTIVGTSIETSACTSPMPTNDKFTLQLTNGNSVNRQCNSSSTITSSETRSYKTSATSLSVGDCVDTIGSDTFFDFRLLTSASISNSVTAIGNSFQSCSALTTINVPSSVVKVEPLCFLNCTSLPVTDNIRYADTYAVEAIDKTLTSYSVKSGTRFIGSDCFSGCTSLTSVSLPSSLFSIDWYAFQGCSSLESITIPSSVNYVHTGAFDHCGLTSVTIPNSVVEMDEYAFYYCTNLLSATIGSGLSVISNSAFSNCSALTSVSIPSTIETIEDGAFKSCESLSSVTIPNSVRIIKNSAFNGCHSLTSVTIGSGIEEIESYVFSSSPLQVITCTATTPPIIDTNTFKNISMLPSNAVIRVPSASVEAYKAATNWSSYARIIEGI